MRYRFGDCELVSETRELVAGGQPRAVEPQVFDLLRHLIEHRERIVSQDELLEAIWGGRIVSDSAISARISAARSAIGDDGARQQWIRTLPRHGFRFVGTVEVADTGAPTPLTPPATASVSPFAARPTAPVSPMG